MTEHLSMDQAFIARLSDIVKTNLRNENFSAADLAREAEMSRMTIHRKLKTIKNQDASKFIKEIRLQEALELLRENSHTASEIAFMVGFGSPAYFNRCFHDFYGYPPGQIKKEGLHKPEESGQGMVINTTSLRRTGWRTLVFPSSVILFFAVMTGLGYIAFFNKTHSDVATSVANQEKSIAVLPFRNDSSDPENAYFINGIMEEALNNLQKIKGLIVRPRTSVEQYRGTTKTVSQIAKELGVNYIIEGAGQKYGNKFVIRVQLINAEKETHLMGKSFEKEILETSDQIALQSDIAMSIASELKVTITPEEKQLIEKIPTTNLTAYDFYLRGNEELTMFWNDNRNKPALIKAEDFYNKSLKYDSVFARAYVGQAMVYWHKQGIEEYFSKNFADSALILCNIALSFDNNLEEAYLMRGLYYRYRGENNKAIDEFDKSLKINPNLWLCYLMKAYMYQLEDYVNSIENFMKAASLNRGSELQFTFQSLSLEFFFAGFPEKEKFYNLEAFQLNGDSALYFRALSGYEPDTVKKLELLQKAFDVDTTRADIAYELGITYMLHNRPYESLKYYKKQFELLEAAGAFTNVDYGRMGWAYWENGYKKEAEYYFDKQLECCKNDIELKRPWGQALFPYYDMAGIYAFRGEKEKAYENLKKFNKRKIMPLWAVTFMKNDPFFKSIRNEPEYKQIVREVEAKYQAEHERVRKWLEEQGML